MKTKSLAQSIALALMLAFTFQLAVASMSPCFAEEAAAAAEAAPAEGEEVAPKETGIMPALYSWLIPGLGQWYARGWVQPIPKKTIGHCLLSGGLMIIGLGFIPWIISIWDAYTGRTESWLNGYL